jgi:hypothetical protein
MTKAIFTILTKINEIRTHYGFGPLSQYQFETPAEWRAEFKRVMAEYRDNKCPWSFCGLTAPNSMKSPAGIEKLGDAGKSFVAVASEATLSAEATHDREAYLARAIQRFRDQENRFRAVGWLQKGP